MSHRSLPLPLSATLILLALVTGCGKANPVAPSGSTITLSANPAVLSSPTGTSTITAVVRKPNGTVAAGVDVRFTTTIGTIDVLKQTDSGGIATATLHGDGRPGTASVNAVVDGGATATALMVPIGGGAKTITLEAVPANIPSGGGTTKLIAIVRDATGQPAAGVAVNFSTNLGTLASKGGFRTTNGSGEAMDTLTIAPSDVTNQTSLMVTATAAAPDGTLQTATATISLVNPNAAASITLSADPGSISASKASNTITLTAVVLNSVGSGIDGANVLFTTTFGQLSTVGPVTTKNGGIATNTLTVGAVTQGQAITVTAQVPGVSGSPISTTTTITVTQ
jgi:adhesin/invasin